MPNNTLDWHPVRADFGSSTAMMKAGTDTISNVGTIFGQLRKDILDREQQKIENDFRNRQLNEEIRQFGLRHGLELDRFGYQKDKDARDYDLDMLRFQSEDAYRRGSLANDRARISFAQRKEQQDREDARRWAYVLSGGEYRDNMAEYNKRYAPQIEAERLANENLTNLLGQRAEQLKAQEVLNRAEQNRQATANNTLSTDTTGADAVLERLDELGGVYNTDDIAELVETRNLATTNSNSSRTPTLASGHNNARAMSTLTPEQRQALSSPRVTNAQIAEARAKVKQAREALPPEPVDRGAWATSHPRNQVVLAAEIAPGLIPMTADLLQSDMALSNGRTSERRGSSKSGSTKNSSGLITEVQNIGLQPNYVQPFTEVALNAKKYANDLGVNISDKDLVILVKNALEVQEELLGSQYETNSGFWQRIFGGTSDLRRQGRTIFEDENLNDPQLRRIRDSLLLLQRAQSTSNQ